jgi:asparagine synthase (glutamine-hydrolysing)
LHTRLSIIDLDPRSSQPMQRSGLALTFNGEIYNYVELRALLARQGDAFATASDTEVLLAGLARHGIDWLDRAEGMWAFGLYDERDGSLRLSRDRFGEKPLYLMAADDGWYFGSEVKFLAALAGRWPAVNIDHVRRYLVNGYRSLYKTDETFFRGVRELPAGRMLTLRPSSEPVEQAYWQPPIRQDEAMTYADAVEGVRERVVDSVRLRLRSDLPIAFCMSGGVDSNSLISNAKRQFGYDVHGFTVMNADARYEERDMVDVVVRELDIRHTGLPIERHGFIDNLRALVAAHDAPVYTISYYVHWLLMRDVADRGYRVTVSGTAADELFSGYYDHHNAYLAEMATEPAHHAEALAHWTAHVQGEVRNPYLRDPDLFVRDRGFRDHLYLNAERFAANLTIEWHEDFVESRFAPGLLRNRMLNEMFVEAVPVILHEDDLNAMYYSIENRSPFLDRRLFEFANAVPTRHLIRNGYAKAVLRDAMRGIVPDAILDNHRKVGFNASLTEFIDPGDRKVREAFADDGPIFEHVRRDAILPLLDKDSLSNSESKFLFNFICAKWFLELNQVEATVAQHA